MVLRLRNRQQASGQGIELVGGSVIDVASGVDDKKPPLEERLGMPKCGVR